MTASTSVGGRGVGGEADAGGNLGNGGGQGRGGGRRTLWEDEDKAMAGRGKSSAAGPLDEDYEAAAGGVSASGSGTKEGNFGGRGGGGRGGGRSSRGSGPAAERGAGGGGAGVNPAMLESEFLASNRQFDAGLEGSVASLSLEEVPYDRDLRCVRGWISVAGVLAHSPRGVCGDRRRDELTGQEVLALALEFLASYPTLWNVSGFVISSRSTKLGFSPSDTH